MAILLKILLCIYLIPKCYFHHLCSVLVGSISFTKSIEVSMVSPLFSSFSLFSLFLCKLRFLNISNTYNNDIIKKMG